MNQRFFVVSDRFRICLLSCLFWIMGLCVGAYCSNQYHGSFFSEMQVVWDFRSILTVLIVGVLPFWITAYAVYIDRIFIFFPLCFFKAAFSACCGGIVYRAYNTAGWLVQPICQWLSMAFDVAFLTFLLRRCFLKKEGMKWDLLICMALCVFAVIVYFSSVLPFLVAQY